MPWLHEHPTGNRSGSRQAVSRLRSGAMPPLGCLFHLPVYLDVTLTYGGNIVFTAGTHRDAIHMGVVDFLRLVDPVVTSFAAQQASTR